MAGKLYGRASSYLSQIKQEVSQHSESAGLEEVGRTLAHDIAEAEHDFSAAVAEANAAFQDLGAPAHNQVLVNEREEASQPPSARRLALEGRMRRHRLHMPGKPSSSERWFRLRRIYRKRQAVPSIVTAPAKARGPEGIWKIA
jgi:ectoine hydroxylase-related dioxygenase (phytanoyl-CoA dioxygenase family)